MTVYLNPISHHLITNIWIGFVLNLKENINIFKRRVRCLQNLFMVSLCMVSAKDLKLGTKIKLNSTNFFAKFSSLTTTVLVIKIHHVHL